MVRTPLVPLGGDGKRRHLDSWQIYELTGPRWQDLEGGRPLQAAGALVSGRSKRNPKKDHLDKTPTMVDGDALEPPAALRPLTVAPGSITSPWSNRMHCPPLGARRSDLPARRASSSRRSG